MTRALTWAGAVIFALILLALSNAWTGLQSTGKIDNSKGSGLITLQIDMEHDKLRKEVPQNQIPYI